MKRIILWTFCCLGVVFIFVSCLSGNRIKYPAGKDTVQSFGDGTYQISSGSCESLFNEEYHNCIIQKVNKIHQTGTNVYIIGTNTQKTIVDDAEVGQSYKMYAVIELQDNMLMLCAIPANPLYPDVFIVNLDEMLDNGDVVVISELSGFSHEDFSVFQEMEPIPN